MKKICFILAAMLITALSLFFRTDKATAADFECQVLQNNIWYICDESNDKICSSMLYNGKLTFCLGNKVARSTEIQ